MPCQVSFNDELVALIQSKFLSKDAAACPLIVAVTGGPAVPGTRLELRQTAKSHAQCPGAVTCEQGNSVLRVRGLFVRQTQLKQPDQVRGHPPPVLGRAAPAGGG